MIPIALTISAGNECVWGALPHAGAIDMCLLTIAIRTGNCYY